ncbi:unnamed protein product, partial [Polarella glacialis]
IAKHFEKSIREEVAPAVAKRFPSWADVHVDLEHTHLGQEPLKFHDTVFGRKSRHTSLGTVYSNCLHARFEWDSKLSAVLRCGVMTGGIGIRNFSLRGNITIQMVGESDDPPYYTGLRVFFFEQPTCSVDFQGMTACFNHAGAL